MYLMFLCKLNPIRNCENPSIYARFRDWSVYSNYTSPAPILPLFSFVPVGHTGCPNIVRAGIALAIVVSVCVSSLAVLDDNATTCHAFSLVIFLLLLF